MRADTPPRARRERELSSTSSGRMASPTKSFRMASVLADWSSEENPDEYENFEYEVKVLRDVPILGGAPGDEESLMESGWELDAEGRAVQRMRSFTHLMPGEIQGSIGCHSQRNSVTPGMQLAVPRPTAIQRPLKMLLVPVSRPLTGAGWKGFLWDASSPVSS